MIRRATSCSSSLRPWDVPRTRIPALRALWYATLTLLLTRSGRLADEKLTCLQWDVTYKPSGVFSAATGGTAHSRSHGVGEFAWHTDGSFEETPQRFFGLHVIHPDKHGGGIFRVLPADDLVAALSPSSVEALLNTEFDIQVPAEFYKGRASNKGKLLDVEPGTGRYLLRFRRDILPDPPSENPSACEAVRELNALLETPEKVGWRFPGDVFKDNVVLLMDNARFLHSRTEIKDKRRLLRRVRFHGTPQV